jgi:hypothetical protein
LIATCDVAAINAVLRIMPFPGKVVFHYRPDGSMDHATHAIDTNNISAVSTSGNYFHCGQIPFLEQQETGRGGTR